MNKSYYNLGDTDHLKSEEQDVRYLCRQGSIPTAAATIASERKNRSDSLNQFREISSSIQVKVDSVCTTRYWQIYN
jgi:hypothetical protein